MASDVDALWGLAILRLSTVVLYYRKVCVLRSKLRAYKLPTKLCFHRNFYQKQKTFSKYNKQHSTYQNIRQRINVFLQGIRVNRIRLWDPIERKLITRRDMKFVEIIDTSKTERYQERRKVRDFLNFDIIAESAENW